MKLTGYNFNYFSYTKDDNVVIDVDLPGVDPKNVKLSYCPDEGHLYINDLPLGLLVKKHYDLAEAKANMRHGLMKITVPPKKIVRPEIPIITD